MSTSAVSRIVAVITACVSSTCAFFVITRSGVAGTIMGAAIAGLVYGTTSQWVNAGIEKAKCKCLKAQDDVEAGGASSCAEPAPEPPIPTPEVAAEAVTEAPEKALTATNKTVTTKGQTLSIKAWAKAARSVAGPHTKALRAWTPAALGLAALILSAVALAGGEESTQIIKERVVEKPVVQERVIVTHETIEVPVYVAETSGGRSGGTAGGAPTGGTEGGTESTTTIEAVSGSTSSTTVTVPVTTPTTAAPETVAQSLPPTETTATTAAPRQE